MKNKASLSDFTLCTGCNQPLLDGQLMNGIYKCHVECLEASQAKRGAVGEFEAQMRINLRLAQDGIIPGHPLYEKLGGKNVF